MRQLPKEVPEVSAPFIVGITGLKRSGKDTAATALVDNLGFKRYAFADPIKRDLIELDPIMSWSAIRLSEALVELDFDLEALKNHPVYGPEWRRLCQRYGTEVWRAVDPDIWVRRTLDAIQDDMLEGVTPGYVVTDMRFPNELVGIPFDLTIRIERPGVTNEDPHESERYIQSLRVDEIVTNDASILALHARTLAIVQRRLAVVE